MHRPLRSDRCTRLEVLPKEASCVSCGIYSWARYRYFGKVSQTLPWGVAMSRTAITHGAVLATSILILGIAEARAQTPTCSDFMNNVYAIREPRTRKAVREQRQRVTEWPIREADIARRRWHGRKVPRPAVSRCSKRSYSITPSARTRKDSGTVSPSAFAVVTLTMRSNLLGCSTGRTAGFAPRKILST